MTLTDSPKTKTSQHGDAPQFTDAIIVGAGVSGIGTAVHFQHNNPDDSFILLDAQDSYGGTWWTHRYPGARSDSDLYTYGYEFKPWTGPARAGADLIRDYLRAVIDEPDPTGPTHHKQTNTTDACTAAEGGCTHD